MAVRDEKTGQILTGVRARRSGRFSARIRDSTMKKQIGLGTFDTAQQAFEACLQAKKAQNEMMSGEVENMKERKWYAPVKVVRDEKTGEILAGVGALQSGKYRSRTWDHTTQKQVILGTFDTAQQASEAYKAKRAQLEAAKKPKRPKRRRVEGHRPVVDEKTGEMLPGIWTLASGKYGARILDPVQEIEVSLGTFDNVEEACNAYQAKRAQFLTLSPDHVIHEEHA